MKIQKWRWFRVGDRVVYTAKAREARGEISHRRTGDRGVIWEIHRGHVVHMLVEFEDEMDVCGWANLRREENR